MLNINWYNFCLKLYQNINAKKLWNTYLIQFLSLLHLI